MYQLHNSVPVAYMGERRTRMKQKTPEQELELLREGLLHERAIWEHINENGCNDPFWTDAAQPWTSKKAWDGDDFPRDHSYHEK